MYKNEFKTYRDYETYPNGFGIWSVLLNKQVIQTIRKDSTKCQ